MHQMHNKGAFRARTRGCRLRLISHLV